MAGLTLTPPNLRRGQGDPQPKVRRVYPFHCWANDRLDEIIQPEALQARLVAHVNDRRVFPTPAHRKSPGQAIWRRTYRPREAKGSRLLQMSSPTYPFRRQSFLEPLSSSWAACDKLGQSFTRKCARASCSPARSRPKVLELLPHATRFPTMMNLQGSHAGRCR